MWHVEERHRSVDQFSLCSILGQNLRIRVIEAPPFVIIRNSSVRKNNDDPDLRDNSQVDCSIHYLPTSSPEITIYGFVADVIEALQSSMGFTYTIDVAHPTTSYHEMAASVAGDSAQYQMAVSDIRITANRLELVDFSTSIHENTFRVIVRQNPSSLATNLFSCFNPFTWDAWVAIGGLLIYSGVIIMVFEYKNMGMENFDSRIRIIFIGVSRTLSSVVIRTGEVPFRSHSTRLTVIALYALGIILVAVYTANLSSFLTLTRNKSTISGIDDIKNGRIPFSRVGVVTNSAVSDYFVQNISKEYYPLQSSQEIYDRLLDYTIDAAIWDSTIIEYAVAHTYSNQLVVVGVGFVRSSFGIAVPKHWPYKVDLDKNILKLRENQLFERLENRWFSPEACSLNGEFSDSQNPSKTENFSLEVLSGIFLPFFMVTLVAIMLHIFPIIQAKIPKMVEFLTQRFNRRF